MQRLLHPLCLVNEAQSGRLHSQVKFSEETVLLADELLELYGLESL